MKYPLTHNQLEELERLVPEYVPQAGDTMEAIQRQAGKRELVLQLKRASEKLIREAEASPRERRR